MGLIYAGIDEAGYGPMLGPLCVGLAVLRIEDWSPGDPPPDVWELLGSAVCKGAKETRSGAIAVADSKKLKLSNSVKTKHPLVHLERGVLTHIGALARDATDDNHVPAQDAELLGVLGATTEDKPWFGGDPITLPLGSAEGSLAIAGNQLRRAMGQAGVSVESVLCLSLGVAGFNRIVRDAGTKGATTERALVAHLRTIGERWGGGEHHVRVACDRQSGRLDYRRALQSAWPGARIETLEQSPRASRYEVTLGGSGPVGVQLTPSGEERHYPIALASMTAKLVRELAMLRFNRYWSARVPELKPTAGYVQDARRWLVDASDAVEPSEREAMVRIA